MPSPIPIYNDHDNRYRADSCRPLVEAAGKTIRIEALKHGHYPGKALPAESLAGVKMVGFWDAPTDQAWGLPWHRNEGIEVAFLETGKLEFGVDQKQYHLQAGDLTVTRPWQLHRIGYPNVRASRLHWLILDVGVRRPHQNWRWPSWVLLTPPDLEELIAALRLNEEAVWKGTPDLRRCFQEIGHAVSTDSNGGCVSHLTLRLNELLLLLLHMARAGKFKPDPSLTSTRRTVQLFLDDLAANPAHLAEDWSVDAMAKSCGLGVSQFSHHVKCLVNLTPLHYLIQCRLDHAAKLLTAHPCPSVTETALQCGFSSSQYFATVFKKRFGCSPREIRSPNASLPPLSPVDAAPDTVKAVPAS